MNYVLGKMDVGNERDRIEAAAQPTTIRHELVDSSANERNSLAMRPRELLFVHFLHMKTHGWINDHIRRSLLPARVPPLILIPGTPCEWDR
jgi:hypothetical protein